MTNYEKNKEWFDEHELGFKFCGRSFAVDSETQKPVDCSTLSCGECEFHMNCNSNKREEWLKAKVNEVDWDAIPKDTLIEVKYDRNWEKRYFAVYYGYNDRVYYFTNGDTSKTTGQTTWTTSDNARLCLDN